MSRNRLITLAVIVIAAIVVIIVVMNNQTGANPIVAERQEAMKGLGSKMGTIDNFVTKGEGDAAAVATAAQEIQATASKIPDLFPAGTSMNDNVGKTGAKPEIWANFDAFKAAATKMGDLAGALATAAGGGDKQAITDAFAALGKDGCGGCHSQFRQKLE
jgi:cytochrome c556